MIKWFTNLFNSGRPLSALVTILKVPESELLLWSKGLPPNYSYNTFSIPKRRQNAYRQIDAPNPSLKKLQKTLHLRYLRYLKVHPSCCGFVRQKSITDNARSHVGQSVVINLDLQDFFTSTSKQKVFDFFRRLKWGRTAANILTNICCYLGHLPQGAPTSPALSNLVNSKLDHRLFKLSQKFGGTYTRYADDLTFSFKTFTPKTKIILKLINTVVKQSGYLVQKKKKIRIQRHHQRQTVTGLVVNTAINLPRTLRRRIRAMAYYQTQSKLPSSKLNSLKGYQSLLLMIEKSKKS